MLESTPYFGEFGVLGNTNFCCVIKTGLYKKYKENAPTKISKFFCLHILKGIAALDCCFTYHSPRPRANLQIC
jgi:hypothetical protein